MLTSLSKGQGETKQPKVLAKQAELLHCSQHLQKDTWFLLWGYGDILL